MHEPPEDTRAYFRGRCLSKYSDNIAAASWDSVIFDLPGHESLQRVPDDRPAAWQQAPRGRPARPATTRRSASSRRSPASDGPAPHPTAGHTRGGRARLRTTRCAPRRGEVPVSFTCSSLVIAALDQFAEPVKVR